MNLKGILFFLLVSLQQFSFAETSPYIWLELGAGFFGVNADIKFTHNDNSYAIGYSSIARLKNNHIHLFSSSPRDRKTGEHISETFGEISAMKLWRFNPAFGYFDLGIGLGVSKGETASNCTVDNSSGFTILSGGDSEVCDSKSYTTLSIPMEANAVIGRFIGLGFFGRASLSAEDYGVIIGMSVPIGKY